MMNEYHIACDSNNWNQINPYFYYIFSIIFYVIPLFYLFDRKFFLLTLYFIISTILLIYYISDISLWICKNPY